MQCYSTTFATRTRRKWQAISNRYVPPFPTDPPPPPLSRTNRADTRTVTPQRPAIPRLGTPVHHHLQQGAMRLSAVPSCGARRPRLARHGHLSPLLTCAVGLATIGGHLGMTSPPAVILPHCEPFLPWINRYASLQRNLASPIPRNSALVIIPWPHSHFRPALALPWPHAQIPTHPLFHGHMHKFPLIHSSMATCTNSYTSALPWSHAHIVTHLRKRIRHFGLQTVHWPWITQVSHHDQPHVCTTPACELYTAHLSITRQQRRYEIPGGMGHLPRALPYRGSSGRWHCLWRPLGPWERLLRHRLPGR